MTPPKLIIDMDGVLWHGETPLPGLNAFFDAIRASNIPFVLATNNAMRTAEDYVQKLGKFGVAVKAEQVLTSSEATASYLRRQYSDLTEVYAVGESGLHRALSAQGFSIVSPEEVRQGAAPEVVVTALIREHLSYELLAMACLAVNRGAEIIATNADSSYPTEVGMLPGAGAVLSVITTATGKSATVVGKPEPIMFEEALRRLNAEPAETLMIGDRLNTDILGSSRVGIRTVLLLSGVSKREDIPGSGVTPDYVFTDIQELTTELLS